MGLLLPAPAKAAEEENETGSFLIFRKNMYTAGGGSARELRLGLLELDAGGGGAGLEDPNGPMYYKGIYHLFYQYNPNGSLWGNIIWAHSVSTDLINWIQLEPALERTNPSDNNGCWSGSTTILACDRPVILYTGIDSNNRQVKISHTPLT
uniref:Glycosyl hydrolase family 32 N-terminal domain-containing protein n=1 Tax=Ananas comosus var. bracteatus TaxID=296719 RepID=A0A6V7P1W7_ANACO|nr:unnamed protein product [Ananas comosus var. bracteatus]